MPKSNTSNQEKIPPKRTGKRGAPRHDRVGSALDPVDENDKPPVIPRLSPPSWLLKEGKEVWERIYPTILLHPAKADLFAAMCQRFGHAIHLEMKVKTGGKSHKENAGGVHELECSNGATKQWLAALKLAKELGITTLALPQGDGTSEPVGGAGGGTQGKMKNPTDAWIFEDAPRPDQR